MSLMQQRTDSGRSGATDSVHARRAENGSIDEGYVVVRSDATEHQCKEAQATKVVANGLDILATKLFQDNLRTIAKLQNAKGIAQTAVINERASFMSYFSVVQSSLERLVNTGDERNGLPEASSHEIMASLKTQLNRDIGCLFNQATTLRDAEWRLNPIEHQLTQKLDRWIATLNELSSTQLPDAHQALRLLEEGSEYDDSQAMSIMPSLLSDYKSQLAVVDIARDRLVELCAELNEQLVRRKLKRDNDLEPLVSDDEFEQHYETRKIPLQRQLDFACREAERLYDDCLSQGLDPDEFRER